MRMHSEWAWLMFTGPAYESQPLTYKVVWSVQNNTYENKDRQLIDKICSEL